MTSNDLNQIDDLLKKRLAESESRVISEVGKYMEDEILPVLDSHSNALKSHTNALKSHTKMLHEIIDSSEQNSNNTQKLNKRVTKIEDNLGIVPPPELTVIR